MKKNILKILIIILFFVSFTAPASALEILGCDPGNSYSTVTGESCADGGGGGGGGGGNSSGGPSGYIFCTWENQQCNFSGIKDVAYGANGRFIYKNKIENGISCNGREFRGDPIYGVIKVCYIKDSVADIKSDLFVTTDDADHITYTTAILRGRGGVGGTFPDGCDSLTGYSVTTGQLCNTGSEVSNISPVTAYFRYSKTALSPIFCNDIYGTNISTKDIFLGTTVSTSFFQPISDLTPDTTYYYCAIISNKENIAYGGSSIVKEFHTSPYKTTVRTSGATSIGSDSATLNGTISSIENVTTYFQYKKPTETSWSTIDSSKIEHIIKTGESNVYGNIYEVDNIKGFNLTKLDANTTYQFRAVGTTCSGVNCSNPTAVTGKETKIVYGPTLNFTTIPTPPTTIKTNNATLVKSNSAKLNGAYSSIENVVTYFQYKEATSAVWNKSKEETRNLGTNKNISGNIYYDLLGLNSSTNYQFRAVVKTDSGEIYGSISNFTTRALTTTQTTPPPNCVLPYVLNPLTNTCVALTNGTCPNGASNPPTCTITNNNTCTNGAVNPTLCTVNSNGQCINGTVNPPACTTTNNNTCTNGAVNPTLCTTNSNGQCINGANNPPVCTTSGSFVAGTWSSTNGGVSGTWGTGTGSGTWTSTVGTGGTETATWTTTSVNGGTWRTNTGSSGTWTSTAGTVVVGTTGIWTGVNTGTWSSTNGGVSGTWGTGTGSGSWVVTTGTGGTGIVTWTGTGNGRGTWTSTTGSGTWSNGLGTGGAGTGTWTNLVLGQTATPPNDAIVRYREGIETVFTRQILANSIYTDTYGYREGSDLTTFAWDLSDQFARKFGYVNSSGKEIRVSYPDIAAYQLQLIGNKLTVYEYYDNKIIDIRDITTVFKNASSYEYYFKK